MPSVTLGLTSDGPIIRLVVFASAPRRKALTDAGLPIPKPVTVTVLVDTGASGTCIDPTHLQQLGIVPSGVTPVHTPSTGTVPVLLNQYDVDIGVVLDNGNFHFVDTLPVVEADFSCQTIDGLLGRDVLSQGILIFNGSAKTFTLSF